MSKTIMITEEEILGTPNDYDLGEKVRIKYWEMNEGKVKKSPWVCSVCSEDTSNIDKDYLEGYDHLNCRLTVDMNVEYDNCVICGKVSPYTRSTHIDRRIGYVEGCGQGCFQPNNCDNV